MDNSVDKARSGPAGAKARQGLTDAKLRDMPPRERAYKVSDGGNGLYVVISPSGSRSFRYDYRFGGRRETLTIGRHEPVARQAQRSHLAYGMDVTLEEARLLLARARVDVSSGRSPARAKVEQRSEVAEAMSFGRWATRYFEFKSDAKSGAERLADSTLSLRRSIYNRILAGPFAKLNLDEIKPVALGELLDRVKSERGPGPAVHARELVLQVYRFAAGKGVEVDNPAEALARKAYATFVPRERNLSRHEIKALLDGLEQTGTAPTLRLAVRFMLLTGVRKGEFIGATWSEVDWERAQWSIPAERMKAGKPHTVYLAEQALDILTTLRTCFPSSKYIHPSRYDSAEPLSQATLNRTIAGAVDRINEDRSPDQAPFLPVSVHDLRRTFSSRLNDALFPEALIEACLAHQKKDQVAAAYNHARLAGPRRALMQAWADMLSCWMRGETARQVIIRGKMKIDEAAHDTEGMSLYASLKLGASPSLPNQFNSQPSIAVLRRKFRKAGCRTGPHLGDHAVEVDVTGRDSHESSDLAHTIGLAIHEEQSARSGIRHLHTDARTVHILDGAEARRIRIRRLIA